MIDVQNVVSGDKFLREGPFPVGEPFILVPYTQLSTPGTSELSFDVTPHHTRENYVVVTVRRSYIDSGNVLVERAEEHTTTVPNGAACAVRSRGERGDTLLVIVVTKVGHYVIQCWYPPHWRNLWKLPFGGAE